MKDFMLFVNIIVVIASILTIAWFLASGSFGTAWLCVIPLMYAWFNGEAISEDN